jgi:hypothetical protein
MGDSIRERLLDGEELLFRQVHPTWLRDGRPSGQAFTPTKKDKDQLSTACASLTSAEQAFVLHVQGRQLKSAGTWAVTVGECETANVTPYHDPTTSPPETVADPAHASVDFSLLPSNSKKEAAGAWLARLAATRGCLFSLTDVVQ